MIPQVSGNGADFDLAMHRFTVAGLFDVRFTIGANLALVQMHLREPEFHAHALAHATASLAEIRALLETSRQLYGGASLLPVSFSRATPDLPRARAALERTVTRHTAARVEPRGMGQEYWVIGRQGLSELLFGARQSLVYGVVSTAIGLSVGALLGILTRGDVMRFLQMRGELGLPAGRGKRYSWGYGACPDLEDHDTVFALLPAEQALGMTLTSARQLIPEQSTAALVVHHPEAIFGAGVEATTFESGSRISQRRPAGRK